MKICSVCGISKDEQDFFYRNRKNDKLHSHCKNCYIDKRRSMWREHYHIYGSQTRERALERNRKLKAKLREQVIEYFFLEFDHTDPAKKSFGIAKGIHDIISWPKILVEIEKCQILCANCHKIKTSEEQGWYKSIAELS